MKEIYSKGEDCVWLAQQLKNKMSDYITFNKSNINNSILSGVYKDYNQPEIRFYIKYCKNEFLRIQIDKNYYKFEHIINAMEALIEALSTIEQDGLLIGAPLAFYEIGECLTCEYEFKNIEETISSLQNNTKFIDGNISNLKFINNCLNCMNGECDIETRTNNTCMEHEYEEELDIKVLCRSIIK